MASTKNPHIVSPEESANRTEIALLLARWLRDHGYSAEDVAGIAEYGREAVVRLTRCDRYARATGALLSVNYVPSDATWAAAMTILRDGKEVPDPFAGFPRLA